MTNISNNTITIATNKTKQFVSNNGKMLFLILFLLTAIIFIIVYLYRFFKKQKKKDKENTIIYPGYSLPCPDYWTEVNDSDTATKKKTTKQDNKQSNECIVPTTTSTQSNELKRGVCYNPKQLGTCRTQSTILYGDSIYLVNLTNNYIIDHKDKVEQPLTINNDISYNTDISYITLSDNISSCTTSIDSVNKNDLNCYTKKNITNKLNYTQRTTSNHFIKDVQGTLREAEGICNGENKLDLPLDWKEWTNPELAVSLYKERLRELKNNKEKIPKGRLTCLPNKNISFKENSQCPEFYEKNLPDVYYYKELPSKNGGYQWQTRHPGETDIPKNMECQAIKKYNNIFKLIYTKINTPASSLIEGNSKDRVWVRSFCKNDMNKKEILNTLIPSKKSIWTLEKTTDKKNKDPIQYYNLDDTKLEKHTFYIKHTNSETLNTHYVTLCTNNIISSDTSSLYISHPSKCKPSYISVVSSQKPAISSDISTWIFYKYTDNSITLEKTDTTNTINTKDKVYIGSMYKYDVDNNRPTYFLSTCGNKKNDKFLQLIEFKDLQTSDSAWSFIIQTSSKNNPIVSEVDFNTILGININKNPDIVNNKHNLIKKCEWAKSCGVTWDVVDKLC
jgi:uncharacterized protein YueI